MYSSGVYMCGHTATPDPSMVDSVHVAMAPSAPQRCRQRGKPPRTLTDPSLIQFPFLVFFIILTPAITRTISMGHSYGLPLPLPLPMPLPALPLTSAQSSNAHHINAPNIKSQIANCARSDMPVWRCCVACGRVVRNLPSVISI